VTQNDAVANELHKIENLRVILDELVITTQYLTPNQPFDAKFPVFLGHLELFPTVSDKNSGHFPVGYRTHVKTRHICARGRITNECDGKSSAQKCENFIIKQMRNPPKFPK
jgi:hypothetical protein